MGITTKQNQLHRVGDIFNPESDHHMWEKASKVTNSETWTKFCLVQFVINLKCLQNASPVQKMSWFVSPCSSPPLRCFEKWYYSSKIRWLSLAFFLESSPRNSPPGVSAGQKRVHGELKPYSPHLMKIFGKHHHIVPQALVIKGFKSLKNGKACWYKFQT